MPDVNAANLPTLWSAHAVNELYRCGLRFVIISPGSRSTPLTLAFAAHTGIEKIVVLDERAAAFRALGIARESDKPAALVCTSGTAVSNYLPALTEAAAAGIPLIALTADRPPNQRQIGANQTIPQNGIFDSVAVFSADAGEPVHNPNDLRRLELLAAQAYHATLQHAGPAHLNFPFRKPLEPEHAFFNELSEWYTKTRLERPEPIFEQILGETNTLPKIFSEMLSRAVKPVVIAGPAHAHTSAGQLIAFFQNNGVPILAEAGSGVIFDGGLPHFICGFNAFLRNAALRDSLAPDLIIRLGDMPTGKGLELYLNDFRDVPHILISRARELSNPSFGRITRISVPDAGLIQVPSDTTVHVDPAWTSAWTNLSAEFQQKRRAYFAAKPTVEATVPDTYGIDVPNADQTAPDVTSASTHILTDGDVHQIIGSDIPAGHRLMISNSFPARDADTFAMPEIASNIIHMNRGASGIDGINSTAAGIARAAALPTWLITGDLAFLHDLSGLLNLNQESITLTIVVINNTGGTIFRMLPVYTPSDWYTTYFETPQHADMEKISLGLGFEFRRVLSRNALKDAISEDFTSGVRVIECCTDAQASMVERSFTNRMFTEL